MNIIMIHLYEYYSSKNRCVTMNGVEEQYKVGDKIEITGDSYHKRPPVRATSKKTIQLSS